MATIIDGKAVAARVRADVATGVTELVAETGAPPGLATVLVGDDPGSDIYVSNKQKASREVGIDGRDHRLAADASQDEVGELLSGLNDDTTISGILLQLPVPDQLDGDA